MWDIVAAWRSQIPSILTYQHENMFWRVHLLIICHICRIQWFGLVSSIFIRFYCREKNCIFIIKMANLGTVLHKFYDEYVQNTPKKLKLIDAYLFYIVLTGVIQFLYCCLVGTFPFNSFLSGFISTISCFVLGGRLNYTKTNWNQSKSAESIKTNSFFVFFIQFAFACKSTQRTNYNLLEFHQSAVLLTSFWLMSSCIWLLSTSLARPRPFQSACCTAWQRLLRTSPNKFLRNNCISYTNYYNVLNKSICMQ